MSHPLLRTLIAEMVEVYLEEDTGLKTAKDLQKHFGKSAKINSEKWHNHDYDPAPKNEQHTLLLPVHRDKVKEHLEKNGWKWKPHDYHYAHPTDGDRHTIKLDHGGFTEGTTLVKVFKTNHKGSMSTY